jgi:predicted metal-dependent phosphoesterase TrpH
MYKTELHIHTKESSRCGRANAIDIVRLYKEKGYKTIVITDHYYEKYFNSLNLTKWEDIINYLLNGYKVAKDFGDKTHINVLLGIEITLKETDSDYLIYGITEKLLLDNPYLYNYSLKELFNFCQINNLLLIQAHPFRNNSIVLASKDEVHGLEVYNAKDEDYKNNKAYQYAKDNNLIMTSGSDVHYNSDTGRAGIITNKEIKTYNDLLYTLENNLYEIIN